MSPLSLCFFIDTSLDNTFELLTMMSEVNGVLLVLSTDETELTCSGFEILAIAAFNTVSLRFGEVAPSKFLSCVSLLIKSFAVCIFSHPKVKRH